jgi:hypothetical protein
MPSTPSQVELIGFEDDSGLAGLLAKLGLSEDYTTMLPGHLSDVLTRQNPAIVIDSIELLEVGGCNAGGMQEEGTLLRLQTFEVPIDLRINLHAGASRMSLVARLLIKAEGIDTGEASITSDLYIKEQEAIG